MTASNVLVSWKPALGLIGLALTTPTLLAIAAYAPIGNQFLSVGVWITALLTAVLTIWLCIKVLNWFDLKFLGLPSTWLMLLNLFLFVLLAISLSGKPWMHYLSNSEAVLLVGILLLTAISILINVRRSSFLFGIGLTLIQMLFSILAVVGFFVFFLLKLFESSEGSKQVGNSSARTESTENANRMRMF